MPNFAIFENGEILLKLEFNPSDTIESILRNYLIKTSLPNNLNIENIVFLYNSKILNTTQNIRMQASRFFKTNNCLIKVLQLNNIKYAGEEFDHTYTFLTLDEYNEDKFISLHRKLTEFFDEKYADLNYSYSYKSIFTDFLRESNIDFKDEIIRWVNNIKSGTINEFIDSYIGESPLCYALNRFLRNCQKEDYDKIKYFAGPFSYALYRFAYKEPEVGVHYSKTFYRKMVLKYENYKHYQKHIGKVICYPAFTSTSEKDISKYDYPDSKAIKVNNINVNDDISVLLIIRYKCNNSSYPTPCVHISNEAKNLDDIEYLFPAFSFFKIEKIEERDGKPNNPHFIYMNVPNKRTLVEFEIKKYKKIYYDNNTNELYSSS